MFQLPQSVDPAYEVVRSQLLSEVSELAQFYAEESPQSEKDRDLGGDALTSGSTTNPNIRFDFECRLFLTLESRSKNEELDQPNNYDQYMQLVLVIECYFQ